MNLVKITPSLKIKSYILCLKYKKTKFLKIKPSHLFFKNLVFLYWFFQNFSIKEFYICYSFLSYCSTLSFTILHSRFYNFYWLKNLSNFFYIFESLNIKNITFLKIIFKLECLNLFKSWKIIEKFSIPYQFWFSKFFLRSKFITTTFKKLLLKVLINTDKLISSKIFFLPIFSKNINLILFWNFHNLVIILRLFLETLEKTDYLFFDFDFFIKKNPTLQKNIFLLLKNTKKFYNKKIFSNYESFWSFINVSFYLTRSIMFTQNISSRGVDLRILKNFNIIFFRIGDEPSQKEITQKFIWGWRNIFYWLGVPYESFYYNYSKNNFFTSSSLANKNFEEFNQFFFLCMLSSHTTKELLKISNKKLVQFNNCYFIDSLSPYFSYFSNITKKNKRGSLTVKY